MRRVADIYSWDEPWKNKLYKELGWVNGIFGSTTGNVSDLLQGLPLGTYMLSTDMPIINYPPGITDKNEEGEIDDNNVEYFKFFDEMRALLPDFYVFQDKNDRFFIQTNIILHIVDGTWGINSYDSNLVYYYLRKIFGHTLSKDSYIETWTYNSIENKSICEPKKGAVFSNLEVPSRYVFNYQTKEFVPTNFSNVPQLICKGPLDYNGRFEYQNGLITLR